MNLAELIRAARMDQKLSQKALGKLISTAAKPNGVWSTYIGQIEKGDKIPSDDVCVELARILDLERDLVLLTAFRDRAEGREARALFDRLLEATNGRPAEFDDPEIRTLVRRCKPWLQSLAQIRQAHKGREKDIGGLLSGLASLDKKQWEAAKLLFTRFADPFEDSSA